VPANKSQRRLASIAVAANEFDVHSCTIRRWITAGRITAYRVGPRLIKVDLNELDAILQPIGGAV
jgi:excisionase family DNA binding protein